MKSSDIIAFLLLLLLVSIIAFVQPAVAQQPEPGSGIELPFIDRDGDGINDMLQNGWGLRFMERYKRRQLVWEQLKVEIIRSDEGAQVDTNGDGTGDVSVHDFLKQKMAELIDTDGDGVADTPLGDYLGGRFKSFDRDGDGLPDDLSKDDMQKQMKNMETWRKELHDRMEHGKPPFIDENSDGIPDDLPDGFGWRGLPPRKP